MNESETFLQYCGLTCLGGSERKACPCVGPTNCEKQNHPHFAHWRARAHKRMHQHMLNMVSGPGAIDAHFRETLISLAKEKP